MEAARRTRFRRMNRPKWGRAVLPVAACGLVFGKALSTPQRLVEGINSGVEKAGSDYRSVGLFLHGSTIAINTILERTGAKTALLITEGFRDIYEIGRISRACRAKRSCSDSELEGICSPLPGAVFVSG